MIPRVALCNKQSENRRERSAASSSGCEEKSSTIRKTLTGGTYAYHQVGPFTSEYLVRTDAPFPSPQLGEYARRIAQAESRLHPAWVFFDSALVKLATPGASGGELRGQFSYVELDKLRGQWETGEDEALAFPPVTAVYEREAQWGRGGRLLLPHVLTTSEWNFYAHKREVPLRFRMRGALDSTPHPSLEEELIEAIRESGGTYVMPSVAGEDAGALRKVRKFGFRDFQAGSSKSKKKRATKKALGGASRPAATGGPVEGVVYLLRAGPHFKIGKSINFEKRLTRIKLQFPDPVEVTHTIQAANPSQVETFWHRRFVAKRRNGEWFALSEAEVEEFKSVSQM